MKTCAGCKETLPLERFGNLKETKDGLNRRCKPCMNKANRLTRGRNRGKYDHQQRASWLKMKYNITVSDYDQMVIDQGDRCGICEGADKGAKARYWCVDHCHDTLKVRGLLCRSCNSAIGQLGDTSEALQKALDYLTKSEDDTH